MVNVVMTTHAIASIGSTDSVGGGNRPEFIRLPKTGINCPFTGLSRSKLWLLLQEGHIKTVCLRHAGSARGTRLVHLESLLEHLNSRVEFVGKEVAK